MAACAGPRAWRMSGSGPWPRWPGCAASAPPSGDRALQLKVQDRRKVSGARIGPGWSRSAAQAAGDNPSAPPPPRPPPASQKVRDQTEVTCRCNWSSRVRPHLPVAAPNASGGLIGGPPCCGPRSRPTRPPRTRPATAPGAACAATCHQPRARLMEFPRGRCCIGRRPPGTGAPSAASPPVQGRRRGRGPGQTSGGNHGGVARAPHRHASPRRPRAVTASRRNTTGSSPCRWARRRASTAAMGGTIGSTRPTRVLDRSGDRRTTPPPSSTSHQRSSRIASAIVGEVHRRGWEVPADVVMFEEPLVSGPWWPRQSLRTDRPVVEGASLNRSCSIRLSAEVSRFTVATAAPAARPVR